MEPLLAELERIMTPRRGRWLVLGVTAGLITIGAGLVYRAEVARQVEQSRQAELAKRCTGAQALLSGIWDDDRRAAVKHAFLETKVPYAEQNWSRIEARLDDYAEGWADKHTDVCEATSVRQEQSDEVLDLRMGCLQRRRNALTETVAILAEATPTRVENASDLVASLPSLMRCDDIEALQAQWPPPEDPEVGEQVDAEHQQLDRAYALQLAGEFEEGERVARGVIERAERLSHPPLMANALFHHANLVSRMGKYDDARKELEEAHLLATEHGPPGLAARAAGSLAYLLSSDQAESERGGWWGQLAVASSRALSGDPIAEAEALAGLGSVARSEGNLDRALEIQRQILEIERRAPGNQDSRISTSLMNIGVLLLEMGKYDESLESLRKALALDNEIRGAEHPLNATTRYTIAMVLESKGHLEQALEEHERVLALRERSLRTDHPDIGFSLNSMGTTLLLLGRLDDALAAYERALRIWNQELGAEHPAVAAVMTNMGVVLRDQGEFERSQAMTEKALAIREAVLGPEHPEVAFSVLNLGRVRWDQGDGESALAHYRRAVAIWEGAHGNDYTSLAHPLMGMGTVLRSQGKLDEARTHLERALSIQERALGPDHPNVAVSLLGLAEIAILRRQWDAARRDAGRAVEITEGGSEPIALADARFVLARAQWSDESLRPRARTLAQQAEATYADSGPGRAKALAKVRTWLAEH